MPHALEYLLTGVLGLNIFAMVGVGFKAGRLVEKVEQLGKDVEELKQAFDGFVSRNGGQP